MLHWGEGGYFGNRVGEVQDNQAKIEQNCHVGEDGEWCFTPSCHNAADQLTHSDSTPAASWLGQCGSSFIKDLRSLWPIDRNFAARKDDAIPHIELLKQF